nr:MAG TPA: hypothetical protein [Caudoviricetes sp.]
MNANDQNRRVQLELTLDDLGWLRTFLNEGRVSVDDDYKKVKSLHSDLAIGAAQEALRSERARMTKIIEAINKQLATIDEHQARAKKLAAMTPPVA